MAPSRSPSKIFPGLRAAVVFAIAVASGGCAPAHPVTRPSSPPADACPTGLLAVAPANAASVTFLRLRAIFDDPQLGPIVAHSFDVASETALVRRAERDGYDLRTIDRLVIAETPAGTVFYAAAPLDARLVADRLWERLLTPRRRTRDGSAERLEGYRGRRLVGLLLDPACRTAAYLEGRDTRPLDAIRVPNHSPDPDALVVYRTTQVPAPPGTSDVLVRQIASLEARVARTGSGLDVTLRLDGHFDPASVDHLRSGLNALVRSPLGDLAGAVQWLDVEHAIRAADTRHIEVAVSIPWRAASAIAQALRGDVSPLGATPAAQLPATSDSSGMPRDL